MSLDRALLIGPARAAKVTYFDENVLLDAFDKMATF